MSDIVDKIEQEAQDLADDVDAVRKALSDLKVLVQQLKDLVAAGQLDTSRLEAAAAKLAQVDNDLDVLTAPEPAPEPEPEPVPPAPEG